MLLEGSFDGVVLLFPVRQRKEKSQLAESVILHVAGHSTDIQ